MGSWPTSGLNFIDFEEGQDNERKIAWEYQGVNLRNKLQRNEIILIRKVPESSEEPYWYDCKEG